MPVGVELAFDPVAGDVSGVPFQGDRVEPHAVGHQGPEGLDECGVVCGFTPVEGHFFIIYGCLTGSDKINRK